MSNDRRHWRVATMSVSALAIAAVAASCGGGTYVVNPSSAVQNLSPLASGAPTFSAVPGAAPVGVVVTDPANIAQLLGPGDFMAVGIAGAAKPTVNSAEPGSAYIVFAGKSGATGGIEFDVFVGNNETDAAGIFDDASADLTEPDDAAKTALFGYDELKLTTGLPVDGGGNWAGIAFRKGKLVFTISIPDSAQAHDQLIALAKLVIARGSALA